MMTAQVERTPRTLRNVFTEEPVGRSGYEVGDQTAAATQAFERALIHSKARGVHPSMAKPELRAVRAKADPRPTFPEDKDAPRRAFAPPKWLFENQARDAYLSHLREVQLLDTLDDARDEAQRLGHLAELAHAQSTALVAADAHPTHVVEARVDRAKLVARKTLADAAVDAIQTRYQKVLMLHAAKESVRGAYRQAVHARRAAGQYRRAQDEIAARPAGDHISAVEALERAAVAHRRAIRMQHEANRALFLARLEAKRGHEIVARQKGADLAADALEEEAAMLASAGRHDEAQQLYRRAVEVRTGAHDLIYNAPRRRTWAKGLVAAH